MFNKILLSILILFLITHCSSNYKKYDEIKIGMTYDEVEKILDKPNKISRGANELKLDIDKFPYEITRRIDWDTTDILNNPKRWILKNDINTVGHLIYVTWIYEKAKEDTFFVLLNNFREIIDTVKFDTPKYYIGNRQVSKYEYDNTISDPKASGNKTKATKPEKRIEYSKTQTVKRNEIKTGVEKILYKVKYKYCIIFDSSSGRVTEFGYFPFAIVDLEEKVTIPSSNKSS
jgi:hypothetical protein